MENGNTEGATGMSSARTCAGANQQAFVVTLSGKSNFDSLPVLMDLVHKHGMPLLDLQQITVRSFATISAYIGMHSDAQNSDFVKELLKFGHFFRWLM